MKKLLFTLSLCSIFLISGTNIATAQNNKTETKQEKKEEKKLEKEKKKEEEKKKKELEQAKFAQQNIANIESLNFSFYPNTIEPEFGITNELMGAGDFYLTVDKNVMYMNLPYIGSFYINPVMPNETPINLTSYDFLYAVHTTDEVNFQVTIIPTDLINILNQGIRFVFYMNKNTGYARLVVTATNRQEITYTGSFN